MKNSQPFWQHRSRATRTWTSKATTIRRFYNQRGMHSASSMHYMPRHLHDSHDTNSPHDRPSAEGLGACCVPASGPSDSPGFGRPGHQVNPTPTTPQASSGRAASRQIHISIADALADDTHQNRKEHDNTARIGSPVIDAPSIISLSSLLNYTNKPITGDQSVDQNDTVCIGSPVSRKYFSQLTAGRNYHHRS
jgi:hypothetical protein